MASVLPRLARFGLVLALLGCGRSAVVRHGKHVDVGDLRSIQVTPASVSIAQGTGQQFAATGIYGDGSTNDLTAVADWTSSNVAVATMTLDRPGLAKAGSPGSTTIRASYGPITGTASLTVTSNVVEWIEIAP